ncbi:porin family protein [Bradyrhizobium manausense]|uniref:outer membrane protein n=1 Tax=Bradyrhizobium TaxID=374 RepID=UPI001BA62F38|nr:MULTISPECIES: outer membrane beta-barrel protein [Bradyrhizobium]MBR0826368.1 porin family protein [Bradyrhizobium manausense]UVO28776.1 outer membrane beta-barrel protein [Bradyrhizobium arachidis]
MKMHWLGSAAVLPVVLASPALAAPPAPVPYTWTGFYVGLNAGGAWGRFGNSTTVDCNVPGFTPPGTFSYLCNTGFPGDGDLVAAAGTGSFNASGFTGGWQAGYNWQVSNVVAGLEGDLGVFRLQGSRQVSGVLDQSWKGTPFTVTNSASTDWLFTFRGRLGVTVVPNLLVYGTGGLAVTRVDTTTTYIDTNTFFLPFSGAAGSWNGSAIKVGYTVGVGAEYALANNWSVKAEWLYLNFGSITASGRIADLGGFGYSQALSTRTDLTANIARLGVNRKF